MKHIKKVLFGLCLMMGFIYNVNAVELKNNGSYQESYFIRYDDYENYSSVIKKYYKENSDKMLFSIETYSHYPIVTSYDISTDLNKIDNFDKIMAYQAELYYSKDNDERWLKAAQNLIWKHHSKGGTYSSENYSLPTYEDILKRQFFIYDMNPFDVETILNYTDEEVTIDDSNNLLIYYDIVDVEGNSIEYSKDGSNLTIRTKDFGKTKLIFRRYFTEKDYEMEMYTNDNYTNFINAGNFYIDKELVIDVIEHYAVINVDSYLEEFDISYGLYDNGNLIYTFDITKPGQYRSKALPIGQYILKQIPKNNKYAYDNTEYIINVDEISEYIELALVKEQMGKLAINNTNLTKNVFIYDINNNLVKELSHDDDMLVELAYGDYTIYYGEENKLNITIDSEEQLVELVENIKVLKEEEKEQPNENVIIEENDNIIPLNDTINKNKNDISIPIPDTFINSLKYYIICAIIIKKVYKIINSNIINIFN